MKNEKSERRKKGQVRCEMEQALEDEDEDGVAACSRNRFAAQQGSPGRCDVSKEEKTFDFDRCFHSAQVIS